MMSKHKKKSMQYSYGWSRKWEQQNNADLSFNSSFMHVYKSQDNVTIYQLNDCLGSVNLIFEYSKILIRIRQYGLFKTYYGDFLP